MPTCRTGHLTTFYQHIGKRKPTLLLLHGWGHNWESWTPLIPLLSENYSLLIPDLPGFGQSDSPNAGWDMEAYSVWLATFLEAVGNPPLEAVIGHSFGGKLASWAWVGNTLSPSPFPLPRHGIFLIGASGIEPRLSWTRRFLARVLPLVPSGMKRGMLRSVRRWWYEQILQETDYLDASRFQEQTLHKILRQHVPSVVPSPGNIPLHIAWGRNDQAVPLWMAYHFAELSSHSDVFVIPDGDHFIHLTHPGVLEQWLLTMLETEKERP